MGAFDPPLTYEKGTFIGGSFSFRLVDLELTTSRNRHWQSVTAATYPRAYADWADKVSRKATVVGATNIILGGKSIIQKGSSHPASVTSTSRSSTAQVQFSAETCADRQPGSMS